MGESPEEIIVPATTTTTPTKNRRVGKRAPGCAKCGKGPDETEFYPSSPYLCKACHYEQQKKQRLPRNTAPPAARPPLEKELTSALKQIDSCRVPLNIPEKVMEAVKADARTCIHCGATFERYKIGSQWAKNVCHNCHENRKWKALTKAHAFARSDAVVHLVFEGDDLPLLERIRAMCKQERRPIDQEILYLVERGLGTWKDS
jgi:hypothetical protein